MTTRTEYVVISPRDAVVLSTPHKGLAVRYAQRQRSRPDNPVPGLRVQEVVTTVERRTVWTDRKPLAASNANTLLQSAHEAANEVRSAS